MSQFIVHSLMLILAGLIQMTDIAFIGGVKPDIALILIASIFYFDRSWKKRILYALIGAIVLKFTSVPGADSWLFILSAIIIGVFVDYLPWGGYIGILLAITAGTIVMSAQNFTLYPFMHELAYNLIAGLAIFIIFSRLNDKKISRP